MANIYNIKLIVNEKPEDESLLNKVITSIKPKTTEDMIEWGVWLLFIVISLSIICVFRFDILKKPKSRTK